MINHCHFEKAPMGLTQGRYNWQWGKDTAPPGVGTMCLGCERWVPGGGLFTEPKCLPFSKKHPLQLIPITHEFHKCEFAYLLIFICNPKINTSGAFMVIQRHAQNSKKFESPDVHILS